MSGLRARGLQIDDPLGPGPSKQEPPVEPGDSQAPAVHDENRAERRVGGETASAPARSDKKPAAAATGPSSAARQLQDGTEHRIGTGGRAWREWSGVTGVGSFRLPHELLAELGNAARELQLPVGLIVTAAITRLLDQPPDAIAALVDQADDARIQGRRRARRRLTTRAEE